MVTFARCGRGGAGEHWISGEVSGQMGAFSSRIKVPRDEWGERWA